MGSICSSGPYPSQSPRNCRLISSSRTVCRQGGCQNLGRRRSRWWETEDWSGLNCDTWKVGQIQRQTGSCRFTALGIDDDSSSEGPTYRASKFYHPMQGARERETYLRRNWGWSCVHALPRAAESSRWTEVMQRSAASSFRTCPLCLVIGLGMAPGREADSRSQRSA